MKIKEIIIKDYGPIKEFSFTPGNFEIIFGLNESGKTTIVEALTGILFNRDSRTLRYGKPENINIVIESANETYRLPIKKLSIKLPAGEMSSLLYVQASESSLYERLAGSRFWDGIKLMLSQSGPNIPFAKLAEKIFDVVGLMRKKNEWNRDKQNVIDNDLRRSEELRNYINDINEIEKKRLELVRLSEAYEKFKIELKTFENYKNYKNYQELANLYKNCLDKKNSLLEYDRYEDKYLEEWQQLEADRASCLNIEKNFKETESEIKELENNRDELKRKLEGAERENKEPSVIYSILAFFAGFLFLMLSFKFHFTLLIPISVFVFSIVLFIIYFYKKNNFGESYEKISQLKNEAIKIETSISEKQIFSNKLSSGKTIRQIDNAINDLRNKTGLAEFSQVQNKINEKRKIRQELSEVKARIFGLLSEKDETRWARLIQEKKTSPPDRELDVDIFQEKELREKIEMIDEKIRQHKGDIEIFEKVKRTKFNITNDNQAFVDFVQLQGRLREYELEKEAAFTAYQILSQLSSELDDFIQDIINGEDSLSKYFQLVTGHYETAAVRDKDFIVIDKEGRELPSDKISSGTKDQLLLCFRFAALKKLYPQGTFLILDDAFIFADWQRRKKLGNLLKKFVEDGNQVIYLTSDDHTRDLFRELGAQLTTI